MLNRKHNDILDFITAVKGNVHLRVEEDLGQGYVKLKVTEAEKRQARHDIRNLEDALLELLRNSRDAGASQIYVASSRNADKHVINVLDDGQGIPVEVAGRIFEPRVTSKLDKIVEDRYGIHGRGMALFAIRSAVDTIKLIDGGGGHLTNFQLVNGPDGLPEKKDRSTFPGLRIAEGRVQHILGIRNIPRILTEFALDHPISIFFGSQTEILAVICDQQRRSRTPQATQASASGEDHGLREVRSIADRLGFEISQRNIYRILDGSSKRALNISKHIEEIAQGQLATLKPGSAGDPDENVIFVRRAKTSRPKVVDLSSRLSLSDLDHLAGKLEQQANAELRDKYLVAKSTVVRRSRGKLILQFELYDQE